MLVLGIDEVGRGCIAGPLVVGAVIISEPVAGIRDSKLLTRAKRISLCQIIYERAEFIGTGWVSASELDKLGLSAALSLASKRAIRGLSLTPDRVVLDGNYNYLPKKLKAETLIGGDNLILSISAASIVAKVARDNFMIELSDKFPDYGFASHVGYCTGAHVDAIKAYGITPYHRKSFEPVKSVFLGSKQAEALSLFASKEPAR